MTLGALRTPEFGRYVLASLPGWLLAGVVAWAAVQWLDLQAWVSTAVVAAWIVKDVLLFPVMRRFYRSQPAAERIIGEPGVALSALDPRGFVRVHGEIWQARVDDASSITEGAPIRVREIHGLLLVVARES